MATEGKKPPGLIAAFVADVIAGDSLMAPEIKPQACDCLNWCGDDPWLKDGRAVPCQERLDRERREREAATERRRVLDLANRLAESASKHGSGMVDAEVANDLRDTLARFIKP